MCIYVISRKPDFLVPLKASKDNRMLSNRQQLGHTHRINKVTKQFEILIFPLEITTHGRNWEINQDIYLMHGLYLTHNQ